MQEKQKREQTKKMTLKHTAILNNYLKNNPEQKDYLSIIDKQRHLLSKLFQRTNNKYLLNYLDIAQEHITLLTKHIEKQELLINQLIKP